MEQDHQGLTKDLERHSAEQNLKFEQVGEVSRCKECGKEKSKHILICPQTEPCSTKKCFRCLKPFKREYVLAKSDYSLKNNWDYWTEKEENKGKYICNSCLLYLYRKDNTRYLQEVQTKKKRRLFTGYVYRKAFK